VQLELTDHAVVLELDAQRGRPAARRTNGALADEPHPNE